MIPDPTLRKRTCNVCGKVFPTKAQRQAHSFAAHMGETGHSYIRACAAETTARRPDLVAEFERHWLNASPAVEPLSPELKARADREWGEL